MSVECVCGKQQKSLWFISNDPCGLCCATATYLLVCTARERRAVMRMIPLFVSHCVCVHVCVCALLCTRYICPHAAPPHHPSRLASPRLCRIRHSQLVFADYVVDNALLHPWLGLTTNYYLLKTSFLGISFLAMASHARAMLSDPGSIPLEYQPNSLLASERGEKLAMCSRCNGFKPPRTHHCSQCDRCIMKMDHHCPWVNNCVGVNNQKHFVLFCFYTCLLSCYALLLLICRMMGATGSLKDFNSGGGAPRIDPHTPGALDPVHARQLRMQHSAEAGSRFVLLMLLFMEALLFGLFTMAMLTEQLSSILADQTGIERLKHDYVPQHQRSWLHNLSETFGRPFSLLWLLPTTVRYNGLTWLDLMPIECEV